MSSTTKQKINEVDFQKLSNTSKKFRQRIVNQVHFTTIWGIALSPAGGKTIAHQILRNIWEISTRNAAATASIKINV